MVAGYFVVYDRTFVGVYRFDRLRLLGGSSASVSLCPNPTVPDTNGVFQTLRIVTRLGNHTIFFNGTEICRFYDTTYTTGAVIVRTGAAGPPNANDKFEVDYVKIVPLQPAQ